MAFAPRIGTWLGLACWLLFSPTRADEPAEVGITFRAQNEEEVSVFHDEPIEFSIVLTNPAAQSAAHWNLSADRYLKKLDEDLAQGKITKERHDAERTRIEAGKKKAAGIVLGTEAEPWWKQLRLSASKDGKELELPVRRLETLGGGPIATLDASGRASEYFGLSPEGVTALAPGLYVVTARLAGGRGEDVKLTVLPGSIPARDAAALERAAWYHLHAAEWARAADAAERILKVTPASPEGLALRAEAREGMGRLAEALADYQAALRNTPKQYEPPIVLLEKIQELKERLKSGK
ncbi:MAG: hypothetical protein HYZ53_01305 [Planctomycetes bacterium]|nr:hypothetical protein [Planctomycetota bacterium]